MTEAISLEQVYEEIKRIEANMVTKEDINRVLETAEIMSNSETMHVLNESIKDIREGRTKKVTSVKEMLDDE